MCYVGEESDVIAVNNGCHLSEKLLLKCDMQIFPSFLSFDNNVCLLRTKALLKNS